MKTFLLCVFTIGMMLSAMAQLPKSVEKMDGLWAYRAGSGFERWQLTGDVMCGESFRINKLGDTVIAERMTIQTINKRLVMHLEAFHMVNDTLEVVERDLIGKKRKMEFTGIRTVELESLTYKRAFLSKKKMFILIQRKGNKKPQKLILIRQD